MMLHNHKEGYMKLKIKDKSLRCLTFHTFQNNVSSLQIKLRYQNKTKKTYDIRSNVQNQWLRASISISVELSQVSKTSFLKAYLTFSWRRSLSHRNQCIDLLCKSMNWFLYDSDLRHERVKTLLNIYDGTFPRKSLTAFILHQWLGSKHIFIFIY